MAATSVTLARKPAAGRELSRHDAGTSTVERLTAAALLATVAPLIAVSAVTIHILSGQTPFIAHRRVGRHGQIVWVPKLRTMWNRSNIPENASWIEYLTDTAVPSVKCNDPRVSSRFAAFARMHSLDELPQLALVVLGRLRFVGPRPITQRELDEHYGAAQAEVLSATPGLTGLWQVMGRNRLSYHQRRRLDLFLVRRASWKLTAWILLRTVREVVAPLAAW